MIIAESRRGISILYRCFRLPDYGKRCADAFTNKCFKCRFCKAEMSAEDATNLLNRYTRCKDCKHYSKHDKRCKVWNHGVEEYEYCYRGMKE